MSSRAPPVAGHFVEPRRGVGPEYLWWRKRVGSPECGCGQRGCQVSVLLAKLVLAVRFGREGLLSASAQVVPCRSVPCRADRDQDNALTLLIPARLAREPPVALSLGGADETRSLLKTFAASSWACLRSRPVDTRKRIVRLAIQRERDVRRATCDKGAPWVMIF